MRGFRPDDVGLLVNASDPRLSPDRTEIAIAVQRVDVEHNRYRSRIWLLPTDGSGPGRPLTADDVDAHLPRWSPDGSSVAYTARPLDDDEAATELRVAPRGDGDHRTVCTCASGPSELEWSPDGSHLAFVARDPDPERYGTPGARRKEKDMPPRRVERLFTRLDSVGWISDQPSRVFVVAADGATAARTVTPGPFEASGAAWSPDSTRLAFASLRHDRWDFDFAADLFVVDLRAADAPLEQITTTGSDFSAPAFSPDGRRLACGWTPAPSNGPWHGQLALIDLDSRAVTVATQALDRNCTPYPPPRAPLWNDDAVLFLVDDGGRVHLWKAPGDGSGPCTRVVDGDRCVAGFDAVGDTLVFVATTATTLNEVYVVDGNGERRLTDLTGELAAAGLEVAGATRFTVPTETGEDLDCWIMEPEHEPGARVPLLLNIHGGPFTQYGERLFDEFQFEVGAGFGVLFCNPRGSSGSSQAWGRAIRWPECADDPGSGWGGVDYDDLMTALDEAVKRFEWIDADRVGVIGGSYGGYMTSWMIGHTDRFAAAVSERAVNNVLTLEHGSDVAGQFVSYVGVSHLDDPQAYLRQSPIRFVRDMHTPLLILHSESDLRCPVNQAEELFVALRLLGRTPEFVRFPGESHELSRSGAPRHRVQRAEIILDFFARYLGVSRP